MSDPRVELDSLAVALLEGQLDSNDHARLIELIGSDPSNRQAFVESMTTQAMIDLESQSLISSRAVEPKHRRARWPYPIALAAALLLSAAAVVAYVVSTSASTEVRDPRVYAPIATLIESTGTVIVDDDIARDGGEYAAGRYSIDSGSAQFLLSNQVTVDLSGATELSMHGNLSATLTRGAAAFNCPPQAVGFTVHLSNGVRVVDLGTRFVTDAHDDGSASVHVLEGRVRVERLRDDIVVESHELTPAHAAFMSADGVIRRVETETIRAANLVDNGGFERVDNDTWFSTQLAAAVLPGKTRAGWTQIPGGVRGHLNPRGIASQGVASYHLGADGGRGGISQTIVTESGRRYRLTFTTSGFFLLGSVAGVHTQAGYVRIDDDEHRFTTPTAVDEAVELRWTPQVIEFVAAGPSTTITFISPDKPEGTISLDDVIVVPVDAEAPLTPPASHTTEPGAD